MTDRGIEMPGGHMLQAVPLGLGLWMPIVMLLVAGAGTARAQDCTAIGSLLQQGLSAEEVARATDESMNRVLDCRKELSRPIFVGPAGPPPLGAAGPPPRGAAGPPPRNAAGPPPIGAAGPPPIGREMKRLP